MLKFLKEKISGWAKKISENKSKEDQLRGMKTSIKEKKKYGDNSKKEFDEKRKSEKEFKIPKKKDFDKDERKISEQIAEDILHETNIRQEEEIEKQKQDEKKGFFSKIKEKFTKTRISEEEFSSYSEDLSLILLENNVAYEVAERIINELKNKIVNRELVKKEIEKEIKNFMKEAIEDILIEPFDIIKDIKNKKEPYVILFCGINGTGKTTTIAKMAVFLKKENISSVMAAADTFRAASIEQLKLHGEKTDTKVIAHEYGSDPASVGFDTIQYAQKNNIKVVLIDTAGRMHTAKNLLREIEKISKVCRPDAKIFVGESITGNDAVDQVKAFNETIGIDGIILSKADIDEKGGTALSVGYATRKPILFLGTGQDYKDLEFFNKKKFIEKLGL